VPDAETQSVRNEIEQEFRKRLAQSIVGIFFAAVLSMLAIAWSYIGKIPAGIQIPKDAIVAFDGEAACPPGWADLGKEQTERFSGRVLVVAGPGTSVKSDDETGSKAVTSPRSVGEQGGSELVKLEVEHLASHSHTQIWGQTSGELGAGYVGNSIESYNGKRFQNTTNTGGNAPHQNMPPFIALRYCRKTR